MTCAIVTSSFSQRIANFPRYPLRSRPLTRFFHIRRYQNNRNCTIINFILQMAPNGILAPRRNIFVTVFTFVYIITGQNLIFYVVNIVARPSRLCNIRYLFYIVISVFVRYEHFSSQFNHPLSFLKPIGKRCNIILSVRFSPSNIITLRDWFSIRIGLRSLVIGDVRIN